MSAHQLHRMLGITYKTAWFMAHRIRYAMSQKPFSDKLQGVVEVDETYIGGVEHHGKAGKLKNSRKTPVVALVERDGNVRSFRSDRVTARNLREILHKNIDPSAHLITDDLNAYKTPAKHFQKHSRIKHSWGIYAKRVGDFTVHTNSVEGYFSILKRGINGVYHQVGKQHLHRYLAEFDFRYNARKIEDGERALLALKGFEGKRITYRTRHHIQN